MSTDPGTWSPFYRPPLLTPDTDPEGEMPEDVQSREAAVPTAYSEALAHLWRTGHRAPYVRK